MRNEKIKIIFVLPSLNAGGAERILTFLARNLNEKYFHCQLLIIGKEKNVAYCTNGIKTTFLNKKRVLFGIPKLLIYLIRKKPNIVFSSIGHLNTVFGLMAPIFPNTKFVIRKASVISEMGKFSKSGKFSYILSKIAYNNIDSVICQSNDMAIDFKKLYNIPANKISIINNPITEIYPLKKDLNPRDVIRYVTVGRLSSEKGHDRLLNILSQLSHPFHYTMVGSGPNREEIVNKIIRLGLQDVITLVPFTRNVEKILSENDVFLQGSFVEGFPNAALESCVVGTPVFAFDAPGGTKEIITNGVNGYLISNSEEFIDKLESFDKNKWNPKTIRDTVILKFNSQSILKQYEKLLLNL